MMEVFLDGRVKLANGDSRDVLRELPDNSIDSVVTDPPYALVSIVKRFGKPGSAPSKGNEAYQRASSGFMGRSWDTGETAFAVEFWAEVMRVLKPGGHVVAASGTRTYHRLAVAIEDAGFEIRDMVTEYIESDTYLRTFYSSLNDEQKRAFVRMIDESLFGGMIMWNYGSGFPKSLDVSKAIDKAAGAERPVTHTTKSGGLARQNTVNAEQGFRPDDYYAERGNQFRSNEPISPEAVQWAGWGTALKPACEPWVLARKPLIGTVAENVLAHGTGALNIDGCRVATDENLNGGAYCDGNKRAEDASSYVTGTKAGEFVQPSGRWPANICHDGSPEVLAAFPDTTSGTFSGKRNEPKTKGVYGSFTLQDERGHAGDSGSAARFFYSSKADKADRMGSKHPTVKPVDLMQWLVRLVTPPGGVVLDPFAGSGTTGEAAWREGFQAILIEREADYAQDIRDRLNLADAGPSSRRQKSIKQATNDNLPLFGGADVKANGGGKYNGRKSKFFVGDNH